MTEPIVIAADPDGAAVPGDSIEHGGLPAPDTDGVPAGQLAEATDGSAAARLRARLAEIQRGTGQFAVPGWDGDLVLEARVIRDAKKVKPGMRNELFVLEATARVLYRGDDGELTDAGGWAGIGRLMGVDGPDVTTGQIVRTVLDNPLRLGRFAETLLDWMAGERDRAERDLGE